jgi:hypothetical protein
MCTTPTNNARGAIRTHEPLRDGTLNSAPLTWLGNPRPLILWQVKRDPPLLFSKPRPRPPVPIPDMATQQPEPQPAAMRPFYSKVHHPRTEGAGIAGYGALMRFWGTLSCGLRSDPPVLVLMCSSQVWRKKVRSLLPLLLQFLDQVRYPGTVPLLSLGRPL